MLATHPLRVGQQGAGVLPHRLVHQVRAALPVVAHALTAEAIGIGPDAAVVRVVTRLALPRRPAERLAVVGVAARPTDQQALQQIAGAAPTRAAAPPVLLELFGYRREQFRRNQGRDLDGDAVGLGRVVDGTGATRLRLLPAQRP